MILIFESSMASSPSSSSLQQTWYLPSGNRPTPMFDSSIKYSFYLFMISLYLSRFYLSLFTWFRKHACPYLASAPFCTKLLSCNSFCFLTISLFSVLYISHTYLLICVRGTVLSFPSCNSFFSFLILLSFLILPLFIKILKFLLIIFVLFNKCDFIEAAVKLFVLFLKGFCDRDERGYSVLIKSGLRVRHYVY